jgi:hypothetical protein
MWNIVGGLLGQLIKPLSFLFGAWLIKRQGKKEAVAENNAEILEDAQEAQKDRDAIRNLDDDDLSNIVFIRPKDGEER